jgi:hypothetical protein
LNSASGSHPKIQSDMENYRTICETQSLLLTFRITQQYLKINLFFSHWELHNIQNSISFGIEKYATSKNQSLLTLRITEHVSKNYYKHKHWHVWVFPMLSPKSQYS